MKVYKTKIKEFAGTDYKEVYNHADKFYKSIKSKTKRRPYVRSAYFKKQKIFLGLFWSHLYEKNHWEKVRRMKLFACGIELICKSTFEPISKDNPNKFGEILHKFSGVTADGKTFFVQIKEDKRSGQKWLMSVFSA